MTARSTDGAGIVTASWAGTAVFVAVGVAGTILPDRLGAASAAVSIALFLVGCCVFLWAYAVAVGRSRTDAIGIGGLFFLQGTAPRDVRTRLMASLAVEVVTAIAAAAVRPFTNLAFGILVPVYGLALAGLWGARHGTFEPREATPPG